MAIPLTDLNQDFIGTILDLRQFSLKCPIMVKYCNHQCLQFICVMKGIASWNLMGIDPLFGVRKNKDRNTSNNCCALFLSLFTMNDDLYNLYSSFFTKICLGGMSMSRIQEYI